MRIILLGAPGSGKGTHAQFLSEKYSIPKISTGDILRSTIEYSTELSKSIKNTIRTGKLVNDKLVTSLIKERIRKQDCQSGYILDGFPRTISQANTIKNLGIHIDYIVEFYIPYEIVFSRIIGRQVHIPSGRIYHEKFNPPRVKGKDNITGEALTVREDDQEDTIRNRLEEYNQTAKLLIDFYQKEIKNNSKIFTYLKIDSSKTIEEIRIELVKNLEKL